MRFLIRKNVEYSLLVDAPSADEAIEKACRIPILDWDSSTSEVEVDKESCETENPVLRESDADPNHPVR